MELVPCSSLWDRSASAAGRILREGEETPRVKESIARIGPAGERMSPMACVTVDSSRHFGRLGLGAVWGSKNLKALVISRPRSLEPADWRGYNALYRELFELLARSYDHELLYAPGSNLGISRAEEVLSLLIFGEKQGWDAISVGLTLAWAT